MEDCLQAVYERVVAELDAFRKYNSDVLNSFIPFRILNLVVEASKHKVPINAFGKDILSQKQDMKFAELASKFVLARHQKDPRFKIYCSPYLLDALSKSLDIVKGEEVSYEQLLKFHLTQEKKISVISPPVIIPASIAAVAGLLNSISDSIKVMFSFTTIYFEVSFFVLCFLAFLFLLCFTLPTWIISLKNRRRYDFILKVLNYSVLRG